MVSQSAYSTGLALEGCQTEAGSILVSLTQWKMECKKTRKSQTPKIPSNPPSQSRLLKIPKSKDEN